MRHFFLPKIVNKESDLLEFFENVAGVWLFRHSVVVIGVVCKTCICWVPCTCRLQCDVFMNWRQCRWSFSGYRYEGSSVFVAALTSVT